MILVSLTLMPIARWRDALRINAIHTYHYPNESGREQIASMAARLLPLSNNQRLTIYQAVRPAIFCAINEPESDARLVTPRYDKNVTKIRR